MTLDPNDWMWRKATDLIERADRARHTSRKAGVATRARAVWEPEADLFESAHCLTIVVALPGVAATDLQVLVEGQDLIVRGERVLPQRCRIGGEVRRLEIPYGRFERVLALPPGRYEMTRNELDQGCLFLELKKLF